MEHSKWKCLRCDNPHYLVDQFRATGGMFAKIFDVQNKRFTTVSCTKCKYTEMYAADSSSLGNLFDFFTN